MYKMLALYHQRQSLDYAYQAKVHEIKSRKGTEYEMVYPNQIQAAKESIHELYEKDKVAVTLIALPQVGKTGTFLEVAYRACTNPNDDCIIDPRNVFIITGMSDRDWQKQTKNDMLEAFKQRVYHRGRLNKKDREDGFYTNLSVAKHALIILDECHIGAEKDHQVSQMLRTLGLLNIETLRERNVKILEVSATPGATLYDTEKWGEENHSIVILNPSSKYVGFRNFIEEGRLHSSFDLTGEDGINKLVQFIKNTFDGPRWHIIRLPAKSRQNGEFEGKLRQVCARERWNIQTHSANDRVGDIDHHMSTQPQQHVIILIKEFWRAGKRLNDTHVGVIHEPLTLTKDTNVTAQGLVGRMCGNDKHSGEDGPHMFCDVDRIHEYLAWIDAKGDWTKVKEYNSRCLKIKKGHVTSSRDTLAHASNMGITEIVEQPHNNTKTVPQMIQILPEEFKSIKKYAGAWNGDTVMNLIKKYDPTLREELETMQRTHITCPDRSYQKILELEAAVRNKSQMTFEDTTKRIDCYQVFMDSKRYRLFVSVYYGSHNIL